MPALRTTTHRDDAKHDRVVLRPALSAWIVGSPFFSTGGVSRHCGRQQRILVSGTTEPERRIATSPDRFAHHLQNLHRRCGRSYLGGSGNLARQLACRRHTRHRRRDIAACTKVTIVTETSFAARRQSGTTVHLIEFIDWLRYPTVRWPPSLCGARTLAVIEQPPRETAGRRFLVQVSGCAILQPPLPLGKRIVGPTSSRDATTRSSATRWTSPATTRASGRSL